ncbi:MAG: hypothetical protein PF505_10630 [Vallitaleaceae bacterium]|jgi:hypothetical protein|nr:hypothetical protein [Vallitaleaceae bacterium]
MGKALRRLNTILVSAKEKQREKEKNDKIEYLTIEEVIKRYEELLS